jgi:hypothetical protein
VGGADAVQHGDEQGFDAEGAIGLAPLAGFSVSGLAGFRTGCHGVISIQY